MPPKSSGLGLDVVNHHSSNEEQEGSSDEYNWECINHVHPITSFVVHSVSKCDLTSHTRRKIVNVLAHHGYVIIT